MTQRRPRTESHFTAAAHLQLVGAGKRGTPSVSLTTNYVAMGARRDRGSFGCARGPLCALAMRKALHTLQLLAFDFPRATVQPLAYTGSI